MAYRRRSYRRSRPPANYTWQGVHKSVVQNVTGQNTNTFLAGVSKPGVGELGQEIPFDAPHVLQRVRGAMVHAGGGAGANSFPAWIAGFKVESSLADLLSAADSTALPNITDNLKGDDYFLYHSAVCGTPVSENRDIIDVKAKRKFDVGDVIAWILRIENPHNSTLTMDFRMNLRLLWKLT